LALGLKERERLKKILDLSDRLGSLRRRVGDDGTPVDRKTLMDEVRSIAGSVVTIGLPGALGRLSTENRFEPRDLMVILMLLNRRFESAEGTLSGREILSTLFPSTYGVLAGASALGPDSALLASGAVEPVVEGQGVLESRFRLSDTLFEAIETDVTPGGAFSTPARAYATHFEHLADLARLTGHLLRRANAAFDVDPYGNRIYDEAEPAGLIDRRVVAFSRRIEERLALTEAAENFPIIRLAREARLTRDEQLILVALLVQECYYGSPGLEAVECVKMVSKSPEDLLGNRTLLGENGALRRAGLVEILDPVDGKEITGDLTLPRWVSALLLGDDEGERGPIDADSRIEFHEYLKELDDSDRFFRDLES